MLFSSIISPSSGTPAKPIPKSLLRRGDKAIFRESRSLSDFHLALPWTFFFTFRITILCLSPKTSWTVIFAVWTEGGSTDLNTSSSKKGRFNSGGVGVGEPSLCDDCVSGTSSSSILSCFLPGVLSTSLRSSWLLVRRILQEERYTLRGSFSKAVGGDTREDHTCLFSLFPIFVSFPRTSATFIFTEEHSWDWVEGCIETIIFESSAVLLAFSLTLIFVVLFIPFAAGVTSREVVPSWAFTCDISVSMVLATTLVFRPTPIATLLFSTGFWVENWVTSLPRAWTFMGAKRVSAFSVRTFKAGPALVFTWLFETETYLISPSESWASIGNTWASIVSSTVSTRPFASTETRGWRAVEPWVSAMRDTVLGSGSLDKYCSVLVTTSKSLALISV